MSYYWDSKIEDLVFTLSEKELVKLEKEMEATPIPTTFSALLSKAKTGCVDMIKLKNSIDRAKLNLEEDEEERATAQEKIDALNHPGFKKIVARVKELTKKLNQLGDREYKMKLTVPYDFVTKTATQIKHPSELLLQEVAPIENLLRILKTDAEIVEKDLEYGPETNEFLIDQMGEIGSITISSTSLLKFYPEIKEKYDKIIAELAELKKEFDELPTTYDYEISDIDN